MKKIKLILIAFILGLLIVPLFPLPAQAASTLYERLNTGGDGDSASIYGANYTAMQFTTDATTQGLSTAVAHTVTTVQLSLKRVGNPGTIYVALRNAATGVPSVTYDLATGTYDGDNLAVTYGWRQITLTFTENATTTAISTATQYALVVSAPDGDGSNYVVWQVDSGGGLANAVASDSIDGGITWASATPKDCLFQVFGESVMSIESVKVFQNYIEDGDLLICAEVINELPPYAQDNDPSQTFAVQLLSIGGGSVLASVPMVAFGDYPESLYLSADSASSITIGGAYVFRVIGTMASPPSVSYTLQSADWNGDLEDTDWLYFDNWVRLTAQNLEEYYLLSSGTLIGMLTDGGWILTASGGAYFTDAIPGITGEHPSLFQYAKSSPQFTQGTNQSVGASDTAVEIEADFEAAVGTQVAGIANTFGGMFGLDGYVFVGYALEIIMAILVVIGLFAGEGAGALTLVMVLGVPILYIGNYIHAIGIQWTLVFGAAMLFLFVRQFYWKTT